MAGGTEYVKFFQRRAFHLLSFLLLWGDKSFKPVLSWLMLKVCVLSNGSQHVYSILFMMKQSGVLTFPGILTY